MPNGDWWILIGLGILFLLLGTVAFVFGNNEEKRYYDAISFHEDMREFIEHTPERPEPGALKIGGWVALAIGLIMILLGGSFILWS
ncbi:hypothetical protein ACFLXP_04650 [Chloroflexota bacterium]